jgi:hypothetical protein
MPSVASDAISAMRIWSTRSLNAVESVPTHAREPNASDARSSGGLTRPSPSARTHAESSNVALISWNATQNSPTSTTVSSATRLATAMVTAYDHAVATVTAACSRKRLQPSTNM